MKNLWVPLALVFALSDVRSAHALDQFCTHFEICDQVPRVNGIPDYNDQNGDPNKPWVIGNNTQLVLPAGDYAPGAGTFGPAVFLVENASLVIENLVDEVAIAGHVIVCDQASFTVRNATFRSDAQVFFQYFIWADHDARITYENAHLFTLNEAIEALGA